MVSQEMMRSHHWAVKMADAQLTPEDDAKVQAYMKAHNITPNYQQDESANDGDLSPEDDAKVQAYLARKNKAAQSQFRQSTLNSMQSGLKNVSGAAGDVVQGALTGTAKLAQLLSPMLLPVASNKARSINPGQAFQSVGSGKQDGKSKFLRGVGEYAPYAAGEEVAAPASLLGKLLTTGGAGAASSLINNKSSGSSALLSGLVNVLTKGAFEGAEALRPTKRFKTPLSNEQLQQNLDAAKETNTSLGRVIQNPELARGFENKLASLPFTGAKKKLQASALQTQAQAGDLATKILGTTDPETLSNSVDQQGEDALKNVLGINNLEDSSQQLNQKGGNLLTRLFGKYDPKTNMSTLNEDLNTLFEKRRKEKNSIYEARNSEAERDPLFNMDTSNFQSAVKSNSDAINSTNVLKYEPEMGLLMSKLGKYANISPDVKSTLVDEMGNPLISYNKAPTLNEATQLKSLLNKHASTFGSSAAASDRYLAGKFGELAKALDKDIDSSIESSGNAKLKSLHESADKNYKENFLPFLDKDIYKYIGGNADPDKMVSDILATGSHEERSTRLSKLSNLSPQLSQGFAKTYFNRSYNALDNETSHKQLGKLIDQLGPNQMDMLVPSASNQHLLKDFSGESKLYQFFDKAINGDGSVNHDVLTKKITELRRNPTKFNELVPSKTTRKQLTDYSILHGKRKDFLKAINSDGEVSSAKLSTLTENLAKNIDKYNDYVPDKTLRDELSKFRTLESMNKDNPMFNPKTGAQNKDLLGYGSLAAAKGAGAAAGAAIGGLPAAILGAIATPLAVIGGGKALSEALTSPQVREKFVKELMNPTKKFVNTKTEKALITALQGYLNSKGAQ